MTTAFGALVSATMGSAKNADGTLLTQQQIERVIKYLETLGSGIDTGSSFRGFLEARMRAFPPKLDPGVDYVTYSGIDSSGITNSNHAYRYIGARNGSSGLIGNTHWGLYIQSAEADVQVGSIACTFRAFLEREGIEPFNLDYPGSLRDMMWNAGSTEFFTNAVNSGRPIVAFVENAPKNGSFSLFELPVAIEHPDAILNGYPMSALGAKRR